MFTWIQTVMQRHHKWLFSILLVIIIVAFVFTIGNTGGGGPRSPGDVRVEFYGYNLNSSAEITRMSRLTEASAYLNQYRLNPRTAQGMVLQRMLQLYLADQLQIPDPNEALLRDFIVTVPAFIDQQTGQYSRSRYLTVLDQFKNNPQMGESVMIEALIQDFRIARVEEALGGPGYVLPIMALRELEARNTVWSASVARFEPEQFEPELEMTDEVITSFYEENDFRYETGPSVVLRYVTFSADDWMDAVAEPSEGQLNQHYNRHAARWPKEDGQVPALEAVREQVKADWRREQAKQQAIQKANQLTVAAYEATYNDRLKKTPESIQAFLTAQGLEHQGLEPFPREAVPSNWDLPKSALQQGAALNRDRFYSDGVVLGDRVVVFFLESELPSVVPPLEEVRDRVVADFRESEVRRLYNLEANRILAVLQSAVADGKAFDQAAENLGLKVSHFEDFTLENPPRQVDYFILASLQEGMEQGQVRDLRAFGDLGTFVYAASKAVPEYPIEGEEVRQTMLDLGEFTARLSAQGILNELVMKGEKSAQRREF